MKVCFRLLFLLSVPFLTGAEELDFSCLPESSADLIFAHKGQSRRSELNPATGKKALHLRWDSEQFPRLELKLHKMPRIENFDSLDAQIHLTVPPECPAIRLMLRLIDREGEVFQLPAAIPEAEKAGEKILNYKFRKGAGFQSWAEGTGGRKNGKLDFPVRLWGIALAYHRNSFKGELFLNSIRWQVRSVSLRRKAKQDLSFQMDTGNPLHVLETKQTGQGRFLFSYSGTASAAYRVTVTLSGFGENPLRLAPVSAEHTFGPGETWELPFPELPERGIWYVAAEAVRKDRPGDRMQWRRSFAWMNPTGLTEKYDRNDFRFGICSHPDWKNDPKQWALEAKAMRMIGARYLRNGLPMFSLMPKPDRFQPEKADAITDVFQAHGIERIAAIGYSARWALRDPAAASEKRFMAFAPEADAWRRYCALVFRHFKGRVRYYEMWNEVDISGFCRFDEKTYAELSAIAAEELQKEDPEAVLMSSGFAAMKTERGNFQERAMRCAGKYFSVHCFHGHGPFPSFREMIDANLLPMRRRLGISYPWYAHETALTSAGFGESVQAATLWKKLLFSWARGSVGYTWYNLIDKGTNPDNAEHNYGLLTHDLHPKAAFVAYNTLTSLFGAPGTRFVRQYRSEPGVWILEFRNGKELLIAAWSETYGVHNILLRSDAEKAELFDLMGNASPAARSGTFLVLPVTGMPAVLRLSGSTVTEPAPSALDLPETLFLIPGNRKSCRLVLRNPESRPVQFDLRWKLPRNLRTEPGKLSLRLAPGEHAAREIVFAASPEFRSPADAPVLVRFEYELDKLKLRRHLPVYTAHLMGSEYSERPDFVLSRREQVHSRFDADPVNVDKVWSSPADLSADIFVGASDSVLKLRVEVVDDLHRQPYRGTALWNGDSVQCFLEFPGQNGGWELGFALGEDGCARTFCWRAPGEADADLAASSIRLTAKRSGTRTFYEAEIPLKTLKVDSAILRKGFRFNLLVNDNDLGVREGWIRIAPGVGNDNRSKFWPWLMLR